MDEFLLKNRLIHHSELWQFTHEKMLYLRLKNTFGWTNTIANFALKAYNEFLELKIAFQDWDSMQLLPSWCINQVWKHHVLDTKTYSETCVKLCGHVIHYDADHDDDDNNNELEKQRIALTGMVYKARFNRKMSGSVWSFVHIPSWWKEYIDLELKVDNNNTVEKNSLEKCSKKLDQPNFTLGTVEDLNKSNVKYNETNNVKNIKEQSINRDKSKTLQKKKRKRGSYSNDDSTVITRSVAKKRKLSI